LLIDEKRDSFLPSGSWIALFWLPAETLGGGGDIPHSPIDYYQINHTGPSLIRHGSIFVACFGQDAANGGEMSRRRQDRRRFGRPWCESEMKQNIF